MNQLPILFLGFLVSMALSWFGMVFIPVRQLGALQPVEAQGTGALYPQARSGLAQQGREIYRNLGCVSCHTQQIRPGTTDVVRYGAFPTVAQDFLFEEPAMIGSLRAGPDLASVGQRQPDVQWHLRHLYEPKSVVPGTTMPPYRYLFQVRPAQGSPDALKWAGESPVPAGFEVVPKPEAVELAAYLASLKVDAYIFERPSPPKPKAAVPPADAAAPETKK